MDEITVSAHRSTANPRRTTLVGRNAAEAAAPHHGHPTPQVGTGEEHGLQILGDDGGVCADGSCSLPE